MNGNQPVDAVDRINRLTNTVGPVDVLPSKMLTKDQGMNSRPWVAIVSSRLGTNPILHRDVCRHLNRSMIECRQRKAAVLIAKGSAIEPWATRAAELFGVPAIKLHIDETGDQANEYGLQVTITGQAKLSRDWVTVFLADRVDAVYVRSSGNIFAALQSRMATLHDATTRVAVTSLANCAAKSLIQAGAVGLIEVGSSDENQFQDSNDPMPVDDFDRAAEWMHSEGEWLVHCTRACVGPWPGQTEHQYRDELILGDDPSPRTPLDTLLRIIRSRRLIAGAIASSRAYPVVCFSAVALSDLLVSRSYRPHLKRWDYEPWGIALRKSAAIEQGAHEVIYGQPGDREKIATSNQFRFQAAGKTFDWTAEKEWRIAADVDLDSFKDNDVRVFVACGEDRSKVEKHCPWAISIAGQARPKPVQGL
ncbi:MAG: hypothetical protein WBD20_02740 [Pirellulaceae bacterium]